MFAAQYWKTIGLAQFITSGGLGTMGFCLPAAIGVQLGRPDALVIGIDGDGSFQMTLQDLATAVDLKLPIKIFILNNLFLGMVRQWQDLLLPQARFAETPLSDLPDLVKLGRGLQLPRAPGRASRPSWRTCSTRRSPTPGGPVDRRHPRPGRDGARLPHGARRAPLNDMIERRVRRDMERNETLPTGSSHTVSLLRREQAGRAGTCIAGLLLPPRLQHRAASPWASRSAPEYSRA